jgi:uncharacterized membrane protein
MNYYVIASISLLVIYHLIFYIIFRVRPYKTTIGCADEILRVWAANIIEKGKDILAVQSLRNWTMASTLLASTAILIALGVINHLVNNYELDEVTQLIVFNRMDKESWLLLKLILLTFIFFTAFLNFSLSLRSYARVGFMLGTPVDSLPMINAAGASKTLIRGARNYTLGMRGYYLAIPVIFWLFGELFFLIGAAGLIIFLYRVDVLGARKIKSKS